MKTKFTKAQGGFTLVEMALVLVVIGLILGAVSIGKDMQRNAEYKKMKQKFVDQWVQVYNQHYDRVGYVIGDKDGIPTLMVNGLLNYSSTTPDPTTVTTLGTALCNEPGTPTTAVDSLQDFLGAAGIETPPGRGAGLEAAYLYLDTNGNPQQVTVCFQWLPPSTTGAGTGNVMVLNGLTPDLARFLDSSIDGQVNGTVGRFRRAAELTTGTTAADYVATAWPAGNNLNGTTVVTDTEQVQILRAIYRMNQ